MRNHSIDIAKAICIILMVVGHSGCPIPLRSFIYMFHMPCFFFISGYLLNDKYLTDVKRGLTQKVRGSYYPFVKWTLIFILLHNLLAYLHINGTYYSWSDFLERTIRAFTMTGSESLLGGFWFLISLCLASTASLLFLSCLSNRGKITTNYILGGVIVTLSVASIWKWNPIPLPQMFEEQTIMAIVFYLSGYIYKRRELSCQHSLAFGLTLMVVPVIVSCYTSFSMTDTVGLKLLCYYPIAIIGTLGVIQISKGIAKYKIHSVLSYIGERTLYILIFHFLAFKFISLFYIIFNELSIESYLPLPLIKEANCWLWIAYTIAGVTIPLLLWELLHFKVNYRNIVKSKKR